MSVYSVLAFIIVGLGITVRSTVFSFAPSKGVDRNSEAKISDSIAKQPYQPLLMTLRVVLFWSSTNEAKEMHKTHEVRYRRPVGAER